MIRLTYANRTEALLDALVERLAELREGGRSALKPVHIIVPGRHVERFLEVRIAERLGVAANLQFHRLEGFVGRWLGQARAARQPDPDHVRTRGRPMTRRDIEAGALRTLLDPKSTEDPTLLPLLQYVDASATSETRDAGRAALAMRVAALFESYALSRPEMLAAWQKDRSGLPASATAAEREDERWQRSLYRQIRRRTGKRPLADHVLTLSPQNVAPLPSELHIFGLSYVARVYGWAFAALGFNTELRLYTLNPCMEFWEDVPSEGELWARLQKSGGQLGESAQSERFPKRAAVMLRTLAEHALRSEATQDSTDSETAVPRALDLGHIIETSGDPPALTFWGRPGREHVLLLNELTGADFEPRFVDPGDETVLAALQRDVLLRTSPESSARDARPADDSILATECPSVRRELEVVAESIWTHIRADPTLRFNDVAVFVPASERAAYLPHLSAVFQEAQRLPHHVVDLPLATESRVVEAAALLVDLPITDMRRPDLLAVLAHPATQVGGSSRRSTVQDRSAQWADLIDRLGIFHGLDAADHEGTYIKQDLISWDQGVRRLTLGQFMPEGPPLRIDDNPYYPVGNDDTDAAWLALLIRSLINDVRFARESELPLSAWSIFFGGLFRAYLKPQDAREESEQRRCLRAAEQLGEVHVEQPVGYRLAAELLQASLLKLGGAKGEYLADGVVVSALAPMRAIPFRHIYVLGLGEGRFPTTERRDPLDMRGVRRRLGDVTPSERDKYIFFEALLCARDRLSLSWVARDPLSGDTIEPSPVVGQLLRMLADGYVENPDALRRRASVERYEDARSDAALSESVAERTAAEARLVHNNDRTTDLRADVDLRKVLGLSPLPIATGTTTLELPLSALRHFLESPVQGWARAVLRLDRQQDEAREGQTDEPLRAGALDRAQTLRDAFSEALRQRKPPLSIYDETIAELSAQGRWPLGILAERAREQDAQVLDAWRRLYMNTVSRHSAPSRVRFGDGRQPGEVSEVRAPIEVQVRLKGQEVTVRLVGRTEVLVDEGHASLLLISRDASRKQREEERLRYGLRGYLDGLALAASRPGSGSERRSGSEPHSSEPHSPVQHGQASHRALVLFAGDTAQEASSRFTAFEPASARLILGQLTQELLSRSHAYYLPSQAVFRLAKGWPTCTPAKLDAALLFCRRQNVVQYGPLRDVSRLANLPPGEAFSLITARFNPFFGAMGMGVSC